MKSRVRRQSADQLNWQQYWSLYPDQSPSHHHVFTDIWSDDLLISQSNREFRRLGQTNERIGGDFWVIRRNYSEWSSLGPGEHVFTRTTSPNTGYNLGVVVVAPKARHRGFGNSTFPAVTPTDPGILRSMGTTAIALTSPTRPYADLGTFAGELRQAAPLLPGIQAARAKTLRAREAGSEYLNVEFGWKPMINDIRRFALAVKNSEEILDRYEQNSGKRVKGNFSWPVETGYTKADWGLQYSNPSLSTKYYGGGPARGRLIVSDRTERRVWFECVFTYHIPPRNSLAGYRSRANKLLGTDLTPSTLWNLAPWSWAADWFSNTGDIARNISDILSDGLVTPWAYVMETKSHKRTYQLTGIHYKSYPGPTTLRQTFETISKRRVAATPFGFGFDMDNLSPRQAGILGALGASRT